MSLKSYDIVSVTLDISHPETSLVSNRDALKFCAGTTTPSNLVYDLSHEAWSYSANLRDDGSVSGFTAGGLSIESNIVNTNKLWEDLYRTPAAWIHRDFQKAIENYSIEINNILYFWFDMASNNLILPIDTTSQKLTAFVTNELITPQQKKVISPKDPFTGEDIILTYDTVNNAFLRNPACPHYNNYTIEQTMNFFTATQDVNCLVLGPSSTFVVTNNVPWFPGYNEKFILNEYTLSPPDIKLNIVWNGEQDVLTVSCYEIDAFLKSPAQVGTTWSAGDTILYLASKKFGMVYPNDVANRLNKSAALCLSIVNSLEQELNKQSVRSSIVTQYALNNGSFSVRQDGVKSITPLLTSPKLHIDINVDIMVRLQRDVGFYDSIQFVQMPFVLELHL